MSTLASAAAGKQVPAGESVPGGPHVLFVDDEENILNALRRVFRSHSEWTCHFALGSRAAIKVLTEVPVALIVSDHRMPEMTGADLLALIRERRPNTVRMMLTGQANLSDVERAVNAGEIFRFILKPWRDAELVEAVRSGVQHYMLRLENEALRVETEKKNQELQSLNTRLEAHVEERTAQLRDALHTAKSLNLKLEQGIFDALHSLFAFVELARPRLGAHGRRVGGLVQQLAGILGLSEAQQHEAYLAALLHDVGKLSIPAYLAEKDMSVMREEEQSVYRMHPQDGAERLRAIGGIAPICDAIAQHHERFNGRGFPQGLKGPDICDAAYMIGICDFYDSLDSQVYEDRSFHLQESRQKIALTADRNFPQRIVDAMLEVLKTVELSLLRKDAIKVTLQNLTTNMRLARNLYTMSGTLLMAENAEMTRKAIARIRAIAAVDRLAGDIYVYTG